MSRIVELGRFGGGPLLGRPHDLELRTAITRRYKGDAESALVRQGVLKITGNVIGMAVVEANADFVSSHLIERPTLRVEGTIGGLAVAGHEGWLIARDDIASGKACKNGEMTLFGEVLDELLAIDDGKITSYGNLDGFVTIRSEGRGSVSAYGDPRFVDARDQSTVLVVGDPEEVIVHDSAEVTVLGQPQRIILDGGSVAVSSAYADYEPRKVVKLGGGNLSITHMPFLADAMRQSVLRGGLLR